MFANSRTNFSLSRLYGCRILEGNLLEPRVQESGNSIKGVPFNIFKFVCHFVNKVSLHSLANVSKSVKGYGSLKKLTKSVRFIH